jgi:hypothetical protein
MNRDNAMETFDMVALPEEESLARLWLRMSILAALVSESRFIVFRDANETEWKDFRNEFEPENKDDFEAVTRAGVFDSAPESFQLGGMNFDESSAKDLVFDVSIIELKQIILELCQAEPPSNGGEPLAFQLGLPGRTLDAAMNANGEPDYITIEFPQYGFTDDDFKAVHFYREGSGGGYQMSIPFDEEKVCYEYISDSEYEQMSQSLTQKLSRFVKSLFRCQNPTR